MAVDTTRERGHLEQAFFGLVKQTAFGTILPNINTNIPFCIGLRGSSPMQENHDIRIREDVAGNEFSHRSDRYRINNEITLQHECDIIAMLWAMSFGLGEAATTGSGPYVHTLKAIAPGALPVTSLITKGNGPETIYRDMACEGFTISGSGTVESPIQFESRWWGSGNKATPTYTAPAITKNPRFRMGRLSFKIGTFGAEAEINDKINDFNLAWANNHFDGYRPGGNLYGSRAETGNRRAITLTFGMEQGGLDVEALRDNKTRQSIIIRCTDDSGADYVEAQINTSEIADVQRAGGDQTNFNVTVHAFFDPDDDGYVSGNQGPLLIKASTTEALTQTLLGAPA